MLAPSLGVPHEVETELGAARAHLLEEWPTPRGGLPRLLLDRVELYPSGVDPGNCTEHASAMSARTNLPLVVLRGLGGVELEWERDFALGDDVEVCVAKPDGLACHAAPLPRHQVVLSIGPDRVGGRIRLTAGTERINARFSAVLCPVRSPPP